MPLGKVKIIEPPPILPVHGCTKGRIFDILRFDSDEGRIRHDPLWIKGDAGEEIKLFSHEYEIVEDG